MCGVVCTDSSTSELIIVPQESSAMPPSITLGSDPPNASSPPVEGPCQPAQPLGAVSNKEIPTIDLATDENDDLQKAIALSLQEQQEQAPLPGVSAEDREVSKALEVSLRDSSPRTTVDILNPQDRRRQGNIPVGLKNIGNSCWFNVVIQPLFHIPSFREMILRSPRFLESDTNLEIKLQEKRLVPTLRMLFSLLVSSVKKYIDPMEAVILFQGQDMRKNAQQDVCEFIHKLLEKLEEEWKLISKHHGIEKESSEFSDTKDSEFRNPIMNLFYGQSKKENYEADGGPKLETFGQYPLTVKEYSDIHESILASMAGGIPADKIEVIEPVQQDTWFKILPPVLIFSLSRYEYSKEKQRAEKVHNKFDFPECLFMDRYMESNKDIIKEKHVKVAKIKQELRSLYNTLEKYQRFGSGEGKYPLADILKYALEFAENKSIKTEEKQLADNTSMEIDNADSHDDVEMSEVKDKPMDYIISSDISKGNNLTQVSEDNTDRFNRDPNIHISPQKRMRVLPPVPHSFLPGELPILRTCLPRWQKEVEIQVEELRTSINALEGQLGMMYEEPKLKCIPYRLHAVVVHEGQASGGHYWVYIYDNIQNIWLKFNDIQVTECSWQEIIVDGAGGQNNASAYCLMYIDQTRYDQLFPDQLKNMENCFSDLPIDLQEFVKDDNLAFMKELQESENKQAGEVRAVPATAPNSPDMLYIDQLEVLFFFEIQTKLAHSLSTIFEKEQILIEHKNKSEWLHHILTKEIVQLHELASQVVGDSYSEPSLLDFGIYLIKNEQKEDFMYWYGYELLWHLSSSITNDDLHKLICHEAKIQLHQLRDECSHNSATQYIGWKKHYNNFIRCAWYFLYGYKKLIKSNYEASLHHLMQALILHNQLADNFPDGPSKTLDFGILSHCFRSCLQTFSDKLIESFISADTEEKTFTIMQFIMKLVIPCLSYLLNSKSREDVNLVVRIRHRWCQFLDVCPDNKSQVIEQILEPLLSIGTDIERLSIIKIPPPPSALSLYKEYKDTVAMILATREKNTAQTSDL